MKKIEANLWRQRRQRRSRLACQAEGMGGIFYILILILLQFLPFGEGRWGFVYSQSGWVQQSPLPTANALFSVKFVNNTTGFVCGSELLLKTTNSGQLWQVNYSISNFNLRSIDFFDENTGIVVGAHAGAGIILKTTNGGNNWVQSTTNRFLTQVNCTANNTAFIVCDSGRILKSTNRGQNWYQVSSITNNPLSSLSFINDHTGYVVGLLNLIYKTTDGGQNWTQQVSSSPTGYLFSIYFVNANTGYIAGGFMFSEIQKTTDGGNNWYLQNTTGRYLHSINFINVDTGFAVGDGGTILETINGGGVWTFQYSYLFPVDGLTGIYALNPDTTYLIGGPGMIAISTDCGNNWLSQSSGSAYDLNSICFTNLNTGFAIGAGPVTRELIKTTNGGINWLYQNFPPNILKRRKRDMETPGSGQKVYFLDSNIGFVLEGYLIFKTIDGGLNWVNYSFQQNANYNDIYFLNDLTGYITGDSLFKTTNGGINWFATSESGGLAIKFIDFNTGYIAGYTGEIVKTTNGGINWFAQNSGTNEDLYSIYFNNSNTGYVCGVNDVLKTTNGGNNWLPVYNGGGNLFSSIYFVNINTGYCVGEYFNGILKTTNSGNNWFASDSNYGGLSSIFFLNDSIGYACGPAGIIIKTTNGGNPIGIKKISNDIPKNFMLYQNYPNPFNPTTKIKFFISKQTFVTLKIYDVLGQEVATVVNKELSTGYYEYFWNGLNFASGVYFYQLKTKDFEESKKFVLLK